MGTVGAAIVAVDAVWYLYRTLTGRTRPQRITWFIWALIGLLGAGSSLQAGARAGAYAAIVTLVLQVIVFGLSLIPEYGKPGGEWYDIPVGTIAIAGIVAWQLGHLSPAYAAVVAVISDGIGLSFTLRESWRRPDTEPIMSWLLGAVGAAIGAAATAKFSFAALAYPLYLAAGNCAVTAILLWRKLQPGKNGPGVGV